jgi:hypothetical protein
MRTTDGIALVAIAGGLWANVLTSSFVQRALASDDSGDSFAIAGAQGADGNPVVWRLEKKTGKIEFCTLAPQPPEKLHPKPAGPKPGTPEYDVKYPPGTPEHDAHMFDDLPQGYATAQDAQLAALRIACTGSGP